MNLIKANLFEILVKIILFLNPKRCKNIIIFPSILSHPIWDVIVQGTAMPPGITSRSQSARRDTAAAADVI